MPPNKHRSVSKATRKIVQGKIDEAIKSYLDLLHLDHNDARILIKLAELFHKNGENDKAIRYYLDAAGQFMKTGFFERASAVYKQILKLDDSHKQALQNLAELQIRLNQPFAALETYKNLVLILERDGEFWEAIEITEKMRNLAPNNQIVLAKLADLYFKNGMAKNGYQVIKPVIELLRERGDHEQHLRFLQKVAQEDPLNHLNLRELADFYLSRGNLEKAFELLWDVTELQPDDHDLLRQTADLAISLGKNEQAVEKIRELKNLYENRGLRHRARTAVREILELKPDDSEALLELGDDGHIIEIEENLANSNDVMLDQDFHEETSPDIIEPIELTEPHEEGPAITLSPPLAPASGLPDYLEEISVVMKFGIGGNGFLDLRLRVDPSGREVSSRVHFKDEHLEAGINEKAVAEFEQVFRNAVSDGGLASAGKLLAQLMGFRPSEPCRLEMEATAVEQMAPEWSEDTVVPLDDGVELFERDLVDRAAMPLPEPERDLAEGLEPPEGYELEGPIQKLIEFYSAKYKAAASMDLSSKEKRALEQGPDASIPPDYPPPAGEDEMDLDPPEGYQLDPYVRQLLNECAAEARGQGMDPQAAAEKCGPGPPPNEAQGRPPRVHETAVFCPFGPVADLVSETPGAVRETGVINRAPLYTMTYNGRNISLAGPAEEDASAALEELIEQGARSIIILDLGIAAGNSDYGDLVAAKPDGDRHRDAFEAVIKASQTRGLEPRIFGPEDGNLQLMNLDPDRITARADKDNVALAFLAIAAEDLGHIRQTRELPPNRTFTTAWRAGYVALDAAFSLAEK